MSDKLGKSDFLTKLDLIGEPFNLPVNEGVAKYKTKLGGFSTIMLLFITLSFTLVQAIEWMRPELSYSLV